jgi:hypothetical protein
MALRVIFITKLLNTLKYASDSVILCLNNEKEGAVKGYTKGESWRLSLGSCVSFNIPFSVFPLY